MTFGQMKHRFIDFIKVFFQDVQKTDYEFLGQLAYLEDHDFNQGTFFFSRDA
jgi:hypothetical protein